MCASNLIHLLHSATNVGLKQLVSKSGNSDKHRAWCVTSHGNTALWWLREFHSQEKKPCCSFTTGLTRLLPCTGASRTASWLFETWFGAAGGGRDGHSSVHSREGREGNVTGFTTAPRAAACAHAGSVGIKRRRDENYGKRGNRVTDRGNTMNGMSKNHFWRISISRSTDSSAGTSCLTMKLGMWFLYLSRVGIYMKSNPCATHGI